MTRFIRSIAAPVRILALALGIGAPLLSACALGSATAELPSPDIEFMRGCWIERAPAGARHIRLLPAKVGSPDLSGSIPELSRAASPSGRRVYLSIVDDGGRLIREERGANDEILRLETMTAAPPPAFLSIQPGVAIAAWTSEKTERVGYVAISADEGLKLQRYELDGQDRTISVDFDGRRDGCD